ncbi:MAG: YceI family protein [Flavisolibacter sp.]|nr:YceI family protein [Flavisolibacter sp.]
MIQKYIRSKRSFLAVVLLLVMAIATKAQDRYFTKSGNITFFSKAPLEDIEAKNKSVTAVLDTRTGTLQFAVLMKGFEFKKDLMQEHFNENYVESDKYPRSEFKGTLINNSEINYQKPGTYTAKVRGQLTIHGITRDIETTGSLKVDSDNLKANASFPILLSDYKISIPAIVKDKVSNTINVSVDCKLEPLE